MAAAHAGPHLAPAHAASHAHESEHAAPAHARKEHAPALPTAAHAVHTHPAAPHALKEHVPAPHVEHAHASAPHAAPHVDAPAPALVEAPAPADHEVSATTADPHAGPAPTAVPMPHTDETAPLRVKPYLVASPSSRLYALAGYTTDADLAAFVAEQPSFAHAAWLSLLPEAERADPRRFPQELPTSVSVAHVTLVVPHMLTDVTALAIGNAADELLRGAPTRPLVISCATARRAGAALVLLLARELAWTTDEALAYAAEQGLNFTEMLPLRNWVVASILRRRDAKEAQLSPSIAKDADGNALCGAIVLDAHSLNGLVFRQLWDNATSAYTYLLADPESRECVIIDSVYERAERDATLVREFGLHLTYILQTHVHPDVPTGAGLLKRAFPSAKIALAQANKSENADVHLVDGAIITIGAVHSLVLRATPGHTLGCASFVLDRGVAVFTGDALHIRGCGRTDLAGGSSDTLYDSVTLKLFALSPGCAVYPAHDHSGHTSSTIREEKALSPLFGAGRTKAEFVALMAAMHRPKEADEDVPASKAHSAAAGKSHS